MATIYINLTSLFNLIFDIIELLIRPFEGHHICSRSLKQHCFCWVLLPFHIVLENRGFIYVVDWITNRVIRAFN